MSKQIEPDSSQGVLDSESGPINRESLGLPEPYLAPESAIECHVAEIWQKAFNIDQIGLNDDFFDLGGDSLTATLIATVVSGDFGCKFQPSALMSHTTVAAVTAVLQQGAIASRSDLAVGDPDVRSDPPHLVTMRAEGGLPPLFFIHGRLGISFPGPHFLGGLDLRQPVYFIQALGYFDDETPPRRISEIARVYHETMRKKQPTGPLHIGSFCAGAMVAIEIANELSLRNDPPGALVLVDPPVTKAMRRGKVPGRLDILHRRLRIWWKLVCLRIAGYWNSEKSIFAGSEGSAEQYKKHLAEMARIDPDFDAPPPGMAREAYNALQEAIYSAKPRLYSGPVDIISSKELLTGLGSANHPWAGLLPNMRLHIGADTHSELFRNEAGRVAQKIQECIFREQSIDAQAEK